MTTKSIQRTKEDQIVEGESNAENMKPGVTKARDRLNNAKSLVESLKKNSGKPLDSSPSNSSLKENEEVSGKRTSLSQKTQSILKTVQATRHVLRSHSVPAENRNNHARSPSVPASPRPNSPTRSRSVSRQRGAAFDYALRKRKGSLRLNNVTKISDLKSNSIEPIAPLWVTENQCHEQSRMTDKLHERLPLVSYKASTGLSESSESFSSSYSYDRSQTGDADKGIVKKRYGDPDRFIDNDIKSPEKVVSVETSRNRNIQPITTSVKSNIRQDISKRQGSSYYDAPEKYHDDHEKNDTYLKAKTDRNTSLAQRLTKTGHKIERKALVTNHHSNSDTGSAEDSEEDERNDNMLKKNQVFHRNASFHGEKVMEDEYAKERPPKIRVTNNDDINMNKNDDKVNTTRANNQSQKSQLRTHVTDHHLSIHNLSDELEISNRKNRRDNEINLDDEPKHSTLQVASRGLSGNYKNQNNHLIRPNLPYKNFTQENDMEEEIDSEPLVKSRINAEMALDDDYDSFTMRVKAQQSRVRRLQALGGNRFNENERSSPSKPFDESRNETPTKSERNTSRYEVPTKSERDTSRNSYADFDEKERNLVANMDGKASYNEEDDNSNILDAITVNMENKNKNRQNPEPTVSDKVNNTFMLLSSLKKSQNEDTSTVVQQLREDNDDLRRRVIDITRKLEEKESIVVSLLEKLKNLDESPSKRCMMSINFVFDPEEVNSGNGKIQNIRASYVTPE